MSRLRNLLADPHLYAGSALALLALAVAFWSNAYLRSQHLLAAAQIDLGRAQQLQQGSATLQARFAAQDLLIARIAQLQRYRETHALTARLGAYGGRGIEANLRAQAYEGLRTLMLVPVTQSLETFLAEVGAKGTSLRVEAAQSDAPARAALRDAVATNADDAYAALQTYLMLAGHEHIDTGPLHDQLLRFWRNWLDTHRGAMTQPKLTTAAERMLQFFLAHTDDPKLPAVSTRLDLLESARAALRRVVQPPSLRQRLLADIEARASRRFAAITVAQIVGDDEAAILLGEYAVPGQFSHRAWTNYIATAIHDTAAQPLPTTDWVLQTPLQNDSARAGDAAALQQALIAAYKAQYVRAWQRFVDGIVVSGFSDFDHARTALNRLGDPQTSPLSPLFAAIDEETAWDATAQETAGGGANSHTISKEFTGIARLLSARGKQARLLDDYLSALAAIDARLQQIHASGDIGLGAQRLLQQTVDGSGSEIVDAIQRLDTQILAGLDETQQDRLRALLSQAATLTLQALVPPAEAALNRSWTTTVYEPYRKTLADKRPFQPGAPVEASGEEIAAIFGPTGAVAQFTDQTLGTLVVRHGNTLSPHTWSDIGIHLLPAFSGAYARWIAPLGGDMPQTQFQFLPQPAAGVSAYRIDVDGQSLQYHGGSAQWVDFVWPGSQLKPGAHISAVTKEGRSVDIVDFPGPLGLRKLVDSAYRVKHDDGTFDLSWSAEGVVISVGLHLISEASHTGHTAGAPLQGTMLPTRVVGSATDSADS